jgi:hypothetical protein
MRGEFGSGTYLVRVIAVVRAIGIGTAGTEGASLAQFSGYAGKFRCFLERRVLKNRFFLVHLF